MATTFSAPFSPKCSMRRASASGRRSKTRSSASTRSASPICGKGRMSFGFTMARSRPACTAWYRNTEFTISLALFASPNETFETPSVVNTPGFSALIRRMPSSVSTALCRYSSPPVARVKVSASNTSASGATPYSAATWTRRRAISALRSAVCAIPFSSMVIATTAAPYRRTSGRTFFTRSPDFSRFTEFTMQRPG